MLNFIAHAAPPAEGAPVDQIVIATGSATLLTAAMLWLCLRHLRSENGPLARAAAFTERMSGIPGWAALPNAVAAPSLMVALLGMYWDISLHIDNGRDPGPLANPAHYLILFGLYGIFVAGLLAIVLPKNEKAGPASIRIAGSNAPIGGLLMFACGAFALIGFPLDDMWHRLFGQDVTLWGPTHLMLFGGAALTLIGQATLLVEGLRSRPKQPRQAGGAGRLADAVVFARRMGIMGGLLIGLSTLQGEFDFGVPQFRMVFHPLLIALAAGIALVAARIWLGRGGAIATALFFLVVRGGVSLIVGKVFGQSMPALPLYLPEALCVEVAFLLLGRRPLAAAGLAGVGVGTLGALGEYAWTHVVFPLPWTEAMLPEGLILAILGGVAGATLGALLSLGLHGALPRPRAARLATMAALAVVVGCAADGLVVTTPSNARATVTLADVRGGVAHRTTVRLDPASLGDNAHYVTVTAWQGDGHLGVGRDVYLMHSTSPGVFTTTEPLPIVQGWKSFVRLQEGRSVIGVPIRMPQDEALTGAAANAVPAPHPTVTRTFVHDQQLLQRERKPDIPAWLWTAACLIVGAFFAVFIGAICLGVARLGRATARERESEQREARHTRDAPAPAAARPATDGAYV